MMDFPKLTQFSPGGGCGCKISPAELDKIIRQTGNICFDGNLLVGNVTKDDAAVYNLGNGKAIISTTDFFTPVVDNPYDYGRIAATNAISDIYAMGGTPFLAVSILGWPLSRLSADIAAEVLKGAVQVCTDLGVSLAGGHSIDISDPVFGLAVNGIVDIDNIKKNSTALSGCKIFLTKPLGIGILTTAEKRNILKEDDRKKAVDLMCVPNKIGEKLGKLSYVKAMTDVTGFGLLGHLLEICEGSGISAVISSQAVPVIEGLGYYKEQKSFPGGTFRNWKSYGHKISSITEDQKMILCDPQTSGGLLLVVEESGIPDVQTVAQQENISVKEIGVTTSLNSDSNTNIFVN
ncbi:MAG: selenide, water dikinase SelD [Bacteroidia bacterium]|nr:selenide, water dikinase SelD [Bacteroidia bacterium]